MDFYILSLLLATADAICHQSTNLDNFSYLPKLRLLRNSSVVAKQIFCSRNSAGDDRFVLYRGRLSHFDSVIGVYSKKHQAHVCYFKNISNLNLVDVTTLTGGELYTIGMLLLLSMGAFWYGGTGE